MNSYPAWQYDETQQVGKDYGSMAEVEAYDQRHGKFRNVQKENDEILNVLAIRPDQVVIEIGTGTGAFALQAAKQCSKVYAVDISASMLEYAQAKAGKAGIGNVEFCRGGFLTYSPEQPVDVVVTNTAFHHLPDLWKGIALQRMNRMLKPGGQLYLSDVIFDSRNVLANIEQFIEKLEAVAGPDLRRDVEAHVRQEYSTYDWIMDGLLERANFRIKSKVMLNGVLGRYLCVKDSEGL